MENLIQLGNGGDVAADQDIALTKAIIFAAMIDDRSNASRQQVHIFVDGEVWHCFQGIVGLET